MINFDIENILNSDRKIFAISLAICCIFLLLPIVLYYLKRFYNARHDVLIAKRHYKIIAAQILCTILFLFIERPLAILFMNNIIIDEGIHDNYIYFIDRFLYVLSLHINLYLIVLRFWVIHYDIKFNNAQNTAYWHGLIEVNNKLSSQLDSHHTDFYLNYRSTLGNLTYLKRITIIIVSCTITISYGSFVFAFYFCGPPLCDIIFFIVDALISLLPSMIAVIIIWQKTPTFHDFFGIKQEMTMIFVIFISTFIFYISWVAIGSMIWMDSYWIANINVAVSCIISFVLNILPAIWLFHCHNTSETTTTTPRRRTRGRVRTQSGAHAPDSKIALYTILSSSTGFETFMAHLTNEFSAENLVAVVEMLQFVDYYANKTEEDIEELERDYNHEYKPMKVKSSFLASDIDVFRNYLKNRISSKNVLKKPPEPADDDDFDVTKIRSNTDRMKELMAPTLNFGIGFGANPISEEPQQPEQLQKDGTTITRGSCIRGKVNLFSQYKAIILPSTVPQSTIVFTKENCLKHKIVLLCDKYIINDADLQLNISSSCKETILQKKKDIEKLKVMECKDIFNQVLMEIYDLMNGSLTRFRGTQEYQRFIQQFQVDTPETSTDNNV